ncbi:MAG: cytochrome b/b6 domain-containing protein [Deltaproteobacteria bacterium]|nr:cytochrome b/b6 domain-containing protein [Deltaproteobacteria bacterium]
MPQQILEEKNRVIRHGVLELAEHWTIALSGLVLLLSGMFELPMSTRYGIVSIPGFAWSGDFITSLNVHYAASVVFIAAALFHLFYHGLAGDRGLIPRRGDLKTSIAVVKTFFGKGEEPPFEKYLPEQRLAYLGMAAIIAVLILSGLVKTYKNIYAPDLSHTLVLWATWLHNGFFILFILAFIAHIGAILLKPNRPLARGIFTGAVRLDYARHRHPLWIGQLERTAHPSPSVSADSAAVTTPLTADSVPGVVGLPAGSLPIGETAVKNGGTIKTISTAPAPAEAAAPATSPAGDAALPEDAVTSGAPETEPETDRERSRDGLS